MKLSLYQVRQVLKTMTGCSEIMHESEYPGICEIFDQLTSYDHLILPCETEDLFLVEERVPNVRNAFKNSVLVNQLLDRSEETGVVVDSLLSGKNALFLASVVESKEDVTAWLGAIQEPKDISIRQLKDGYLITASLLSFVPLRDDS